MPITALSGYPRLPSLTLPINRWSLPLPRPPRARSLNAPRNQVPIRHPPNDNHWRLSHSLNSGTVSDGHSPLSEPHFPRSCLWEPFPAAALRPLAMKNVHISSSFPSCSFVAHSLVFEFFFSRPPCSVSMFLRGNIHRLFSPSLSFPYPWPNT